MKVVNREEFLKLPPETLYSKFKPDIFTGLCIKGDSTPSDWCYQDLIGNIADEGSDDRSDKCDALVEQGVSLPLDFDIRGRDGLYDKDQLFAVYEPEDVAGLIERLKLCLKTD